MVVELLRISLFAILCITCLTLSGCQISVGANIPEAESGIRWDDATLAIDWPTPVAALSERDQLLPCLELKP